MGFAQLRGSFSPPVSSSEQIALLKRRSFGIHPLGEAGQLDGWRVLSLAWQPALLFVFSVCLLTAGEFRFGSEGVVQVLNAVGVVVVILLPAIALLLLLVGIGSAAAGTRVRPSAVIYWTWWPLWRVILCVAAAWAGSAVGEHLWQHHFLPHIQLKRMQAYADVAPRADGGRRLQDAGIVAFNASTGVDRMRSGCIKDHSKYCVAPIVVGGELKQGAAEQETQDLFMAGVGCCGCPGDFRCGDWARPGAVGGLRVLDPTLKQQYELAAQEWAATHGRSLGRPIFFEWVADPLAAFEDLQAKGVRVKVTALLVVPIAIVLATVALNGLLRILHCLGCVAPVETPPPQPGLGRALSSRLLPHLHKHYLLQKQEEEEAWGGRGPKYVIL